jgi:hypothetical protein
MDLTLSDAQAQFLADSCLYSLDLAVDLYAVGVNPEGQGRIEQRAAAYGLLISELLAMPAGLAVQLATVPPPAQSPQPLLQVGSLPPSPYVPSIALLLTTLVGAATALGLSGTRQVYTAPILAMSVSGITATPPILSTAPSMARERHTLAQELAITQSRHAGLLPLVSALTPGNYDPTSVSAPLKTAIDAAMSLMGTHEHARIDIPPPIETTLRRDLQRRPVVASAVWDATKANTIIISGSGFFGVKRITFIEIDHPDQFVNILGSPPITINSHEEITFATTAVVKGTTYWLMVVTDHGSSAPIGFPSTP